MSRRTHPQLAVSLAAIAVLSVVVPFLAVPVGATGTVSVASAPPEYVAPGNNIVLSLDVADLDELTVDPWASVPTGTTLVVDGQQANFGTTVTFSPLRTGTIDVAITPPSGTVARDSVVVRDPADGSVFAESGPVSVHPRPLSVPAGGSIQAAVDVAANGTTIQLATGDYTENVVVPVRNLTVAGAGQGATEVEFATDDPLFTVAAGATFALRDLTVIPPVGVVDAVDAQGATVTVDRVEFSEGLRIIAQGGRVAVRDVVVGSGTLNVFASRSDAEVARVQSASGVYLRSITTTVGESNATLRDVSAPGEVILDMGGGPVRVENVTTGTFTQRHSTTNPNVPIQGTDLLVRNLTTTADTSMEIDMRSVPLGTGLDNLTVLDSSLTVAADEVGISTRNVDAVVRNTSFAAPAGAGPMISAIEPGSRSGLLFVDSSVRNAVRGIGVFTLSSATIERSSFENTTEQAVYNVVNTAVEISDSTATATNTDRSVASAGEPYDAAFGVTSGGVLEVDNVTVRDAAWNGIGGGESTLSVRNSTVEATNVGVVAGGQRYGTDLEVDVINSTVLLTAPDGSALPGSVGVLVGTGAKADVLGVRAVAETGVRYAPDSNTSVAGAITQQLVWNDLSATDLAVDNRNPDSAVLAPLNYWGPRGPAADRYTGDLLATDPFVTRAVVGPLPPTEQRALPDIQAFGLDLDFPAGDVYAFGAPGPLERNLSETFGNFDGVVYTFDESSQTWTIADGSEVLGPMEAVVVVPTTDARAVVDFEDTTPARATTRSLSTGWNFVAPRFPADAEDAFSSDTIAATDLLSVFSEPEGLDSEAGDRFVHYQFVEDGTTTETCNDLYCETEPTTVSPQVDAFGGYFVYVTEPGTIPGAVPAGVELRDFIEVIPLAEDYL